MLERNGIKNKYFPSLSLWFLVQKRRRKIGRYHRWQCRWERIWNRKLEISTKFKAHQKNWRIRKVRQNERSSLRMTMCCNLNSSQKRQNTMTIVLVERRQPEKNKSRAEWRWKVSNRFHSRNPNWRRWKKCTRMKWWNVTQEYYLCELTVKKTAWKCFIARPIGWSMIARARARANVCLWVRARAYTRVRQQRSQIEAVSFLLFLFLSRKQAKSRRHSQDNAKFWPSAENSEANSS